MSVTTYPVHVEVQVKEDCEEDAYNLETLTRQFLQEHCAFFSNGEIDTAGHSLSKHVVLIRVTDLPEKSMISYWRAVVFVHVYSLLNEPSVKDYLENEEGGGKGQAAYEEWKLPNEAFEGFWDAIVVQDSVKAKLLGYCATSAQFSEVKVDDKLITWNRMTLLNGPPGTGKTTLCKALAQKLAMRDAKNFNEVLLVEINAHALFSKWFSESGKLVHQLFSRIDSKVANDPFTMVTVLIDEVESIASSRTASMTTSEPGDAVRVVNSVLTCLDSLRRRPNALVMCTSNLMGSIDAAFRDRIDLCLFLGNPSLQARYRILWSCTQELISKGIVIRGQVRLSEYVSDEIVSFVSAPRTLMSASTSLTEEMKDGYETASESSEGTEEYDGELMLAKVAAKCEGLSGRRLRKLPLLALAFHIGRPHAVFMMDFFRAIDKAIVDVLQGDLDADSIVKV